MTRLKKIEFLISKQINVKYHLKQFTAQRRLIIDEVEAFNYTNTAKDQLLAGEHIDLLYWEMTKE